jgi:putative endopeptidase
MTTKTIPFFFIAIFTVAIIACNHTESSSASGKKFIDRTAMDSSVKPGDNFYLFVNGNWLKNAKIPPSQSSVGGFTDLYYETQDKLHRLLDSLSKASHVPGTIEQKVGDYYASGMDSVTIDRLGYEPLKPYLAKIAAINNAAGVLQYVAEMQKLNFNILFNMGVGPDDKNSRMNIAFFTQGGLGLPDRDYYFKKDSANLAIIRAYQVYVNKLFRLIGDDSLLAAKKTMMVYNLEKEMAESHKTNVALRDPQSNYHKMSVSDLNKKMPLLEWKATLTAMDIHTDSVNMAQPAYYSRLNDLMKTTKSEVWKAYLQVNTIHANIAALSSDFYSAYFDYNNKALNGQQVMKPRWDRIVSSTDNYLGEALGEIYVNQYFSKEAKARMVELVNNLQIAFDARINKLDWMSDSTKTKAKDKLHAFIKKIGYPDKWRDYSKVTIDRNKFFENRISCSVNDYQRQAAKVGKPVDRTEWDMTPPTINAGYNPSFNEIVFPAGILQTPFFDPAADDAVNYGAIGMGIGHEMTHGFDDQGAQYDKDGNLRNWWTKEDSVKFVGRTKAVILQYDGFVAIDTFHVNGALTTGENIADLGGLNIAYDAFKLTKQGKDTVRIDGLLPDERFFMSFATIWRSKYKDEISRMLVNVDPHSPDRYRVIGPLENFTPFYITFNVQKGDSMYKPESERIKIW